jgi:hypothetical protein
VFSGDVRGGWIPSTEIVVFHRDRALYGGKVQVSQLMIKAAMLAYDKNEAHEKWTLPRKTTIQMPFTV